jgi:AraC family transcriptional activator FtrA
MHDKEANVAAEHTVAVLAYDGLAMFEFAIACEIFGAGGSVVPDQPWYRLLVCGAGPVTLDNGMRLSVPHGLARVAEADTVLVPPCELPGGPSEAVLDAVRRAHTRGARIASLCTGAFVLAEAGLLDGRRATTHWAECGTLAGRHPTIRVDPDVLYLDDGDILTSAGSAASVDLCLHMVRQDRGAEIATRLARELVVPPYRDGGQAQYIEAPLPSPAMTDLFADTVAWAQQHLPEPLSVADLAQRSAMSRRTFARRFAAATGTSPYRWLLRQRLQLAQRLLETGDLTIDAIAEHSGFQTADNLRKHFTRILRTTPQAYRATFRTRSAGPTSFGGGGAAPVTVA